MVPGVASASSPPGVPWASCKSCASEFRLRCKLLWKVSKAWMQARLSKLTLSACQQCPGEARRASRRGGGRGMRTVLYVVPENDKDEDITITNYMKVFLYLKGGTKRIILRENKCWTKRNHMNRISKGRRINRKYRNLKKEKN